MSFEQNAGQNHNTETANRSFENVAQLKCLGMTPTKENCLLKVIGSRLNAGNACYLRSLMLMEKRKLRAYENSVLRKT
jgi:hypothetical protein